MTSQKYSQKSVKIIYIFQNLHILKCHVIWLMFDIKHHPKPYLDDVGYQSSTRWLLVDDWYSYSLGICFLCISFYVDSKKAIQFWHFFTGLCHFHLYEKTLFVKHQPKLFLVDVLYHTSTRTLPGWCLISNINQNVTWLMFYIIHQPELYLVDVWYQTSTKTLPGWCLISIINRVAAGWRLIFIYSRYIFSLQFRICRF